MMLGRSNWLILGLAVLAAAIGGYAARHRQPTASDQAPAGLLGQPAPALSLPDLDGTLHRLSDYRGRRVVLNFWASWCAPCVEEMPTLDRLSAKFGERAPIVIGIAMDDPAHVRAFLAAHPVSYPILIGQMTTPDTSSQLGDIDQILPYSALIGADGRILATHEGSLDGPLLDRWLKPEQAGR
jgi:peroxiredoxin